MRGRWAILGCAVAVAVGVGTVAPQLPILIREGFPAPVWPAIGRFAEVLGTPVSEPPGHSPPKAAHARFVATEARALLVDQPGSRRIEHYGPGVQRDTRLNSYSLVKSLVGALAVKAVADGRILSLDVPLPDILGPDAPAISLREALTMTGGLSLSGEPPKDDLTKPLDDGDYSPFGPLARLHAFGLGRVMSRIGIDPARRGAFHYQSASTALVGAVVEAAYDQPLPDILSEQIWQPAGAETAQWRRYPAGDGVSAYCCLYARPLDWLRVGRFLLNNGSEMPFLPEDMWRAYLFPDLPAGARREGVYGLHIRHDVLDRADAPVQGPFAYMMGHGGQVVYLVPDSDAVVVRFGAEMQLLHSTLYELLSP